MKTESENRAEFDNFKKLLLDMTLEQSQDILLKMTVRHLAALENIALARIWIKKPGDICSVCTKKQECLDRSQCFHLVASAGSSLDKARGDWSRIDGEFKRFPLGVGKIGEIGAGKFYEIVHFDDDWDKFVYPGWARREKIKGYAGQPLLFKGEALGVLAVFSRTIFRRQETFWMRMISNHLASVIANNRAFDEIESLKQKIEAENIYLRKELDEARSFGNIIGQGAAFQNLMRQIELVAPTDASTLIMGESGTGKELVARKIHALSRRRKQPMVRVNCASISKSLYESEFFGHAKGAFTGALKERPGRFEAADGGTLLLDEIGEIPAELQSKLLRVLQEGEYQRVGEETTRRVDVRIIATTNRDLAAEVEKNNFRQDLYYRLNVFPIEVLPLYRRKEDIELLAKHFLKEMAEKMNCEPPLLTETNLLELQQYEWPGNIRELRNIIERAIIISQCGPMSFELSDDNLHECSWTRTGAVLKDSIDPEIISDADMKKREKKNIIAALRKTDWKIYGNGGAAELLCMKPTTLATRIKRMGITRPG